MADPHLFQFTDYKDFFNSWIKNQDISYKKVSEYLNISSTMMSQIFKGDKHLSQELALLLTEFLNFNRGEIDYFLLLVDKSKAGSAKLTQYYERKIHEFQVEQKKISSRIKTDIHLRFEDQGLFYSNWLYSATRMLTGIPEYRDIESIAERLKVPSKTVAQIVEFLLETKLCILKEGKIAQGPAKTFIDSSSPLVQRHHSNWRLLAIQKMYPQDSENLFYTGPMSLSKKAADEIRKELPLFIENIHKRIISSSSEVVRCLNLDWFDF